LGVCVFPVEEEWGFVAQCVCVCVCDITLYSVDSKQCSKNITVKFVVHQKSKQYLYLAEEYWNNSFCCFFDTSLNPPKHMVF